jgi:hypothetical protein
LVVLERLFFFLYALQTLKSIFYPLKVLTQSVDYQYISTSEAKIKVLILDSDHFKASAFWIHSQWGKTDIFPDGAVFRSVI